MNKKNPTTYNIKIKKVESQKIINELSEKNSMPMNMIINQALEIGLPILKEKLELVRKALEQEDVIEPTANEINLKFHELYEVEKITADISKGQLELLKRLENITAILQALIENQQVLNVESAIIEKLTGATYQALILISNASASLSKLDDSIKIQIENKLPERLENKKVKMLQNITKNNKK